MGSKKYQILYCLPYFNPQNSNQPVPPQLIGMIKSKHKFRYTVVHYTQILYMKIHLSTLLFSSLLLCSALICKAQESGPRQDKFYTMSAAGFSFPVGESSSFMRPKFSTTLGANVGIGNKGLFIYPKVSLHVFGYDELSPENGYINSLQRGRSTTYLLNLAVGYRKIINKVAFYGFVGAGGGFILTPRIFIDEATKFATLNNRTNHIGIIEPGAGIEYNIGGANIFIESSYMHGFGKIQHRPFNAVPVSFGIKPNLSRLFNR